MTVFLMDKNAILSSSLNQICRKTYVKAYVLRLISHIKTYNYP